MPVVINGFQTTSAGSGTDDDTLTVTRTGSIVFSGDVAIFMSGNNQRTTILGEVVSNTGRAILSQGNTSSVYVGPTGVVVGQTAVQFGQYGNLDNDGAIRGAVSIDNGSIRNTGTIDGYTWILHSGSVRNYGSMLNYLQVETRDTTGNIPIYNAGYIEQIDSRADSTTVTNIGDIGYLYCAEKLYLSNRGTLGGLRVDDEGSRILNHGYIGGESVWLSSQSDYYDGRNGVLEGIMYTNGGGDTLLGGAQSDSFDGSSGTGADKLYGYGGDDVLTGGANDSLKGGLGDDTFYVESSTTTVTESAGEGHDLVVSRIHSYTLGSNVEDLALEFGAVSGTGNSLANLIIGNTANNVLNGGTSADEMRGGTGNDTYFVDNFHDFVVELSGGGTDRINAAISYTLPNNVESLTLTGVASISGTGNSLSNTLAGNTGNNTLIGLGGNDVLSGGAGNDVLKGGVGKDTLTGGVGNDKFYFDSPRNAVTNVDRIADFSVPADTLVLENEFFTALRTTGTLAPSAFHIGSKAADASDRIIYNATTGALSYDPDGSGSAAMSTFATLVPGLALTNADIFVI